MGINSLRVDFHNRYPIFREVGHLSGEKGHSRGEVGRHVTVLPIHNITYSPSSPLPELYPIYLTSDQNSKQHLAYTYPRRR